MDFFSVILRTFGTLKWSTGKVDILNYDDIFENKSCIQKVFINVCITATWYTISSISNCNKIYFKEKTFHGLPTHRRNANKIFFIVDSSFN